MKHTMLVPAMAALVLVLSACGGPATQPVDVAGDWVGTWSSASGATGSLEATFTQTGTVLSGTVTIGGSPCLATGDITGTISNADVTFGAVSGPDDIAFEGTVGETDMEGTYGIGAGMCAGDSGTFTAVRQ